MDEPAALPLRRHQPPGLSELVDAERAQVAAGHAEPCGKTCDAGCHGREGALVCVRAAHPHAPENMVPHLGYDASGQFTQWTCLSGDHDGLTDQQRADQRGADEQAARQRAAAAALLASVDPALLVQLFRDGGHLSPDRTNAG